MLTKAVIEKLPVEQQEILAQIEFRKTQHRIKLLELARGNDWRSRYFPFFIFAGFLACITFYSFDFFHIKEKSAVIFLPLGIVFIFSLFTYLGRTNRRLDALLQLLDFDREQAERQKKSTDVHVD